MARATGFCTLLLEISPFIFRRSFFILPFICLWNSSKTGFLQTRERCKYSIFFPAFDNFLCDLKICSVKICRFNPWSPACSYGLGWTRQLKYPHQKTELEWSPQHCTSNALNRLYGTYFLEMQVQSAIIRPFCHLTKFVFALIAFLPFYVDILMVKVNMHKKWAIQIVTDKKVLTVIVELFSLKQTHLELSLTICTDLWAFCPWGSVKIVPLLRKDNCRSAKDFLYHFFRIFFRTF